MKKLMIAFVFAFTLISELHAKYFVEKYFDDSPEPVEYQLVFKILEESPEEVGVYYNFSEGGNGLRVENVNDITNLRLPGTVTFEGKTYRVSTIFDLTNWSNSGEVYGTLYIPKTIIRILGEISLSVESIIIEDAPIEEIRNPSIVGNSELGPYFNCGNLKTIDFGNAIKYIGGFGVDLSLNQGCPFLESVIVPASVERIGSAAFKGIPSLNSVTLSSSIKSVGYEAFADCETLTTVDTDMVSENVVEFESEIFKDCKVLKNVSLPSVNSIPDGMFRYCSSLEYVRIGDKSFPDNGFIGSFAFEDCSKLVEIDIPSTFSSIGESAFRNCSSLSLVPLSWNTKIGTGAFSGCLSIKEYKVDGMPDEENEWGSYYTDNGVLYKKYGDQSTLFAYPAGKNDTFFSVPSLVKDIEHYAFAGAACLEEVTIPASVERIGVNVFSGCRALRKVNLPENIEYIPYGTFSDCNQLKEISLPDNIVFISGSAFAACESLEEIKLPEKLRTLGNSSFIDCRSLKTISIPAGVSEIRANTLGNCVSLESVNLPSGLDSIQSGAFQGCTALKGISLPSGLSGLEERAFKDCSSLQLIEIPNSVKNLGVSAFENCTSLKTVDTGNGMEKMGDFAFYNCNAIEKIILGSSLKVIGDEAFEGDDAILSIICKGTTPPDYSTGFSNIVVENADVEVPEGSEDQYHGNPAWNQMVEGVSAVKDINRDELEYSIFDMNGNCIGKGRRGNNFNGFLSGVYILLYSDGTVKKIHL